jgi:peptidoglycan/xylan/chitin deacetylase (PgdA/CDA1 family)
MSVIQGQVRQLSDHPSSNSGKRNYALILACLAFLVLIGAGYIYNRQALVAAVETPSKNQEPTGTGLVPETYVPDPAHVEAESEKPNLPIGLPLEKLGVICNGPRSGQKRVALTFDDGPSKMTPEYLEILQEKGVHATFFLIGSNVQRQPGLAAMIAGDGDEIGNHTYSHLNLARASLTEAVYDILRGQDCIEQATHQNLTLMRPPGGDLNVPVIRTIQRLGYRIVFWNIDPQDWKSDATSRQIIGNIMTNLHPGSIILLHEGKPATLEALPELIDDIREQGYVIDTVSGLLGTARPGANAPMPTTQLPTTQLPTTQLPTTQLSGGA